ncbi:MAG: hypothetical protein LUD54_02175, partial [Oscillospiraceae bacterium]|nr:hypothetical protein [Oscillospiraceae bacterium]
MVDYVGITNHLRDALANYADADRDEIMASLCDNSKDIDALNTAYNEIIAVRHFKAGIFLLALGQSREVMAYRPCSLS